MSLKKSTSTVSTTVETVKKFNLDSNIQGFRIFKEIAQSNFSNVYEVVELKSQKHFAMKHLVSGSSDYESRMIRVIGNEAETCLKILCDFGFATADISAKTQIQSCRHLSDRAPETLDDGEYFLASDVYALGQVIRRIIQGVSDMQPSKNDIEEPAELKEILDKMTLHEHTDRPSAPE